MQYSLQLIQSNEIAVTCLMDTNKIGFIKKHAISLKGP